MIARKHQFGLTIILDRERNELEKLAREVSLSAKIKEFGGSLSEGTVSVDASENYSEVGFRLKGNSSLSVRLGLKQKYTLESGETIRVNYGKNKQVSIHYTPTNF